MATYPHNIARDGLSGRYVAVDLRERFEAHVERIPFHDCWEWIGNILPSGYGQSSLGPHSRRAHRVAYELYYGPIPEGGLICHRCDNRSCVNPAHLFLGSHTDNERDKIAKGRRGPIGRKPFKLLDTDIPDVLRRRASGESFRSIGASYGVTHEAVRSRLKRLEG